MAERKNGDAASFDSEQTAEETRFKIDDRTCCILLAQGLTEKELNVFRSKDRQKFVDAIEAAEIYPFTDLKRKSVV